ncbi:MAG: hypothetical protein A2161_19340 [Candidatus Schekmanbacteria bacterium RBG_13_48_7]|uniref:CstA N-terminal domain-containing protein n=1 Tax=Candidatus Schekmanbacteria bacterium RBG_13_48_7 TaxID=1817878 RepID=A0A1F7RQD6_9BACT|nr:MAG: hypothetical protein A2161_19340 [Candidatus Schekmanbacteria bacterium RBG_13_48_7]
MNIIWLVLIPAPLFFLAYRYYSGYIARSFGEDSSRPTPSVELNDGRDFCPTNSGVVFSHHFASIAGAGPILGPTIAVIYGVFPVWLWLIAGVILIGATHDYTALFISMREKGQSIAQITHDTLGRTAYVIMIGFTIIMLILVTSAFLVASAKALTSLVSLVDMGLAPDQTLLKTEISGDVVKGRIGGIASMSVIIITIFAPVLGYMYYRLKFSGWSITPLALGICIISILIGIEKPVILPPVLWMFLLSAYTLVAAGVPVWVLLQPRDFINVFILYGGILVLFLSIIFCGLTGTEIQLPAFSLQEGQHHLGFIWPVMFITVACGAISGFHSLVAGGTVSKQVTSETAARRIGYLGMLLESLFAICVVGALAAGLNADQYVKLVFPKTGGGNPILAFSLGMSHLLKQGLNIPLAYGTIFGILMVEGFVATTLDTGVRLNRYLFEELWKTSFKNPPVLLKKFWFNSTLAVVLMLIFGLSNAFNAIWPLFGTANQLLAAFTLIVAAAWMFIRKRKTWFLLIPAVFMTITTVVSLVNLAAQYIKQGNLILGSADIVLILLTAGLILFSIKLYIHLRSGKSAEGIPF